MTTFVTERFDRVVWQGRDWHSTLGLLRDRRMAKSSPSRFVATELHGLVIYSVDVNRREARTFHVDFIANKHCHIKNTQNDMVILNGDVR